MDRDSDLISLPPMFSRKRINTIFYIKGGGRFGNQLLTMLHLLAFAKEYKHLNLRIVHIGLVAYNALIDPNKPIFYINTAGGKRWPLFIRIIILLQKLGFGKTAHHYSKLIAYTVIANPFKRFITYKSLDMSKYELSDPVFLKALESMNKVALWGWGFRCWDLLEKYKDEVREAIAPKSEFYKKAQKHISKNINPDTFLVGVLIRQTDYDKWHNGKYYFSTPHYEKWIIEAYKQFHKASKNCKFLICSDQSHQFEMLDNHRIPYFIGSGNKDSGGHYMEDFYGLSMTQTIISPPSTFSGMAAFLKNIPVILIANENQEMDINNIKSNHIFDLCKDVDGKHSIN
jgi:hypothetical protein